MKTEKNIFIAFILNLIFSVFEFIGGTITGSVAIISDAVHDIGDAFSIGLSYFLEKKSRKQPDEIYTYGYARYSVFGSVLTTAVLIFGSVVVLYNAVLRLFHPIPIDYHGMIVFAVIGVVVNFIAAYFTKDGDSLNQKAVNLHMLEDVLGWIVVLIGAIIMRFTNFSIIDPILSICVALFILINAVKNLKHAAELFLEKIPDDIHIAEMKEHLLTLEGVLDVHHIHVWSIDGFHNYATMHVVTNQNASSIKDEIRKELKEHHIGHVTIEIEGMEEICSEERCHISDERTMTHHHHHHHHH